MHTPRQLEEGSPIGACSTPRIHRTHHHTLNSWGKQVPCTFSSHVNQTIASILEGTTPHDSSQNLSLHNQRCSTHATTETCQHRLKVGHTYTTGKDTSLNYLAQKRPGTTFLRLCPLVASCHQSHFRAH